MAWSDDIQALDLRIARQQRYIDAIEGVNSCELGPRGVNADPDNPLHINGCDPDDDLAKAHRNTMTGGADAYFAWWRSGIGASVDVSESNTMIKGIYDLWKEWDEQGQDYGAMAGMATLLSQAKVFKQAFEDKKATYQNKIDTGALDGPQ